MRSLCFLFIWFLSGSVVLDGEVRAVFSLQVSMQANSELYCITAYLYNGRTLTHKKYMSKNDFVHFASGKWPSVYNPKRIDMLAENKIPCGLTEDPYSKKFTATCSPLDSAWKLHYSDYPFRTGNEKGWTSDLYKPSAKQSTYLFQRYGIKDLDINPFIDSAFWKIMYDLQDNDWIANYKKLK